MEGDEARVSLRQKGFLTLRLLQSLTSLSILSLTRVEQLLGGIIPLLSLRELVEKGRKSSR